MKFNLVILTILSSLMAPVLAMVSKKDSGGAMAAILSMKTAMPSVAILEEQLEESGFKELNDVTKLAGRLASQRLPMVSVVGRVEAAAYLYYIHKRDLGLEIDLEQRKYALFSAVLEHDPRALEALTKCGMFPASDDRK